MNRDSFWTSWSDADFGSFREHSDVIAVCWNKIVVLFMSPRLRTLNHTMSEEINMIIICEMYDL
jgi:hypothetical protein